MLTTALKKHGGERAFWAFPQHVVGGMDEKFRTQSSLNSLPFPLQSGGPFQAECLAPFSCLAGSMRECFLIRG